MIFYIHAIEAILAFLIGLLAYQVVRLYKLEAKEPVGRRAVPLKARESGSSAANEPLEESSDNGLENLDRAQAFKAQMRIASSLLNEQEKTLEKAHVFALSQLDELSHEFEDAQSDGLSPIEIAVSCYLIGAVDFIGRQGECCPKSRLQLIQEILASNIPLIKELNHIGFDVVHKDAFAGNNVHMTRAGAKAAKLWATGKQLPDEFSLNARINEWQSFAYA